MAWVSTKEEIENEASHCTELSFIKKWVSCGWAAAACLLALTDPMVGTARAGEPGQFCMVKRIGGFGTGNGEFKEPRSMEVAGNHLVVADKNNHRVQIFDLDDDDLPYVTQFNSSAPGPGFDEPGNVSVDSDGNIFVAEHGKKHRIQKFGSDGDYLLDWGTKGGGAGQFNKPRGLRVGDDDYVYVTERENHRVSVFTNAGVYVGQWGTAGTGNGEFDETMDIALHGDGDEQVAYVVDRENHRIQKFTVEVVETSTGLVLEQEFVTTWGTLGAGDGQFDRPRGVAVHEDDDKVYVYVADSNNNRIQVFDGDGNFVTKFGSSIDWNKLHFVAVADDGNVYVSDGDLDKDDPDDPSNPDNANQWVRKFKPCVR